MQASAACIEMLEEAKSAAGCRLEDAEAFAADLGPGSFTGVRVGIVLAKTFAWLQGCPAVGADSFDLIDPVGVVLLPSKRGEFFVRRPGSEPIESSELPEIAFRGYGPGIEPEALPDAANFSLLIGRLPRLDPMTLVPRYLIEPSISTPKKPYRTDGANV